MAQTPPFASHYLLMVDHNRAPESVAWYQTVFGVEVLHQATPLTGFIQSFVYTSTIYFRILGTNCIIQIQETLRDPTLNNMSYGIISLYVDDPDAVWNRAIDRAAHPLHETTFHGLRFLTFRDIFGYRWAVGSRNTLPPQIRVLNYNLHYSLLLPFDSVANAVDYYRGAFGAVVIEEQLYTTALNMRIRATGRTFLRFGNPEYCLIIEVLDTTRTPDFPPINQAHSHETVIIFTENVAGFVQRITRGGFPVVTLDEQHHQNRRRIQDPFGFVWMILPVMEIPPVLLG